MTQYWIKMTERKERIRVLLKACPVLPWPSEAKVWCPGLILLVVVSRSSLEPVISTAFQSYLSNGDNAALVKILPVTY